MTRRTGGEHEACKFETNTTRISSGKSKSPYQDQGCIVKPISRIDIGAFRDHLLTELEISLPTRLTERLEVIAEIQRAVIFESPIGDLFVLGV